MIRNYVPSVQIKGFDISRLKINHFQTEKRRSGIITKLYTWSFFNSNTFPVLFHCIKGFQIGRKDNERSRNRISTSSGLKFGHQTTFRKLRKKNSTWPTRHFWLEIKVTKIFSSGVNHTWRKIGGASHQLASISS